MTTKNQDIREKAQAAGICLWQIADELGISDVAFSRKLRHELPDSEKVRIREIIEQLKAGDVQ